MMVKFNYRSSILFAVIFGSLYIFSTLNNVPVFNTIGQASILFLISFVVSISLFASSNLKIIKQEEVGPILSGLGLCLLYFLGLIYRGDGINNSGATFLSLLYFFLLSHFYFNKKIFHLLGVVTAVFILLSFISDFSGSPFSGKGAEIAGYLHNPNIFAPVLFLLSFFLCVNFFNSNNKRKWSFLILTVISYILLSGARSVWLAMVSTLLTFFLWPYLSKSKFKYRSYILLIFTTIALVIYIVCMMGELYNLVIYNDIAIRYTGERVGTGRQVVWPDIISAILENPFFGNGPAVIARDVSSFGAASAHNFYLQLTLQVGVLGLMFLGYLFYGVWKIFWIGREDIIVRLSASFFTGILIHQTFEVSLTHNNLIIGLLAWTVIAIGVSRSIEEKRCLE